jgi:hypothetical protein
VPGIDRALWTIQVDGRDHVAVRVGGGNDPAISTGSMRVKSISGVYHDVRCITAVELPAKFFGKETLRVGDVIEIESSLVSHGRAYRVDWKGKFSLSE